MGLHIEERQSEGIVILDLKGKLVCGPEEFALREIFTSIRRAAKVKVIVNLNGVSEIDSGGLGTLVYGLAMMRKAGGRLALINLSRPHFDLILLTRLASAFGLYGGERDAIDSFFPERKIVPFDIPRFIQSHEKPGNYSSRASEAACS
jgi:anti-sigma B factor antagonist